MMSQSVSFHRLARLVDNNGHHDVWLGGWDYLRGLAESISGLSYSAKDKHSIDCVIREHIHVGNPLPNPSMVKPIPSRKPSRGYMPARAKMATPEGKRIWQQLRYETLKASGGKCVCCGRSAKDNITLHVDHIKPVSLYPGLLFDPTNLQVLCEDCNIGKGNRDCIDWR